ncbi:hypothetical protein PoB_005289600 [Plakobranchus ocellatus]|uniref:Uncharacterized protein n=1 Tax=Plakobranchus ocellatus TaxID=259542 RepID=A0AAV4C0V8_9GAST|nr:hypothetical protein PoB_005289600 [Plakobranchus ocellatus]
MEKSSIDTQPHATCSSPLDLMASSTPVKPKVTTKDSTASPLLKHKFTFSHSLGWAPVSLNEILWRQDRVVMGEGRKCLVHVPQSSHAIGARPGSIQCQTSDKRAAFASAGNRASAAVLSDNVNLSEGYLC